MKIPDEFNPWKAMENHRNPKLMKKLLALRRKKNEKKNRI
tara:strand:- start:627 stop:746 length:120 start_codon:yes stop_codon:yes gene_type:complete